MIEIKFKSYEPNFKNLGKKVLLSDGVLDYLNLQASTIKKRAGRGFTVKTFKGKKRGNALVVASTKKAKKANSKKNILLKSLRG